MNRLLPILILNVLILCACGDKLGISSKDEATTVNGNIFASNIKNEDSIFAVVDYNILQYAHYNNIELPANKIRRYDIIDSLIHIIYYSDTSEKEFENIYTDLVISINQLRFLNSYLRRQLKKEVNNQISTLLEREQSLADSLIKVQQSFLKTHIDDAGQDGSLDL